MHWFCHFTKLDKSTHLNLLWNLDHTYTCTGVRKESFEDDVCCIVCNTRPTAGPRVIKLAAFLSPCCYKIRCYEIFYARRYTILEPHLSFIMWLPVIFSVPWTTTVWQFLIPQKLPEGNQNLARWDCFCFYVMQILLRCFCGFAHASCLCDLVAPPENH